MRKSVLTILSAVILMLTSASGFACGRTEGQPSESAEEESQLMSQISSEQPGNEPVKSPFLDGKKLIVFGDSITALGSWGKTVAENLNMHFFNGAMGGITSAQGIARFPAYVASRNADYVTLLFGMNDLIMESAGKPRVPPEQFEEHLTALVRMVRECGAEPILLTANPLDPTLFWTAQGQNRSMYESVGGDPLAWLEVYNGVTRKVAADTGTPLVDMFRACEGIPYGTLLRDGIHLSDQGNRVFAEALTAWFEAHYERDPDAEPVSDADSWLRVTPESGRVSLYSDNPADWFTADPAALSVRYFSNAIRLANTNGLWPYAECLPEAPLLVPVEDGYLYYHLQTRGVSASLILFFGDSTPSAYTEGTYLSLNSVLGAEVNEVGDIRPNQTLSGKIRLSELGIPGQNIQNGLVRISGLKLYVAGAAYEQVVLRELSVGIG